MKKSLVSDVITGRKDVRGIEVPDFKYVEEADDATGDDNDLEEAIDDEEQAII